MALGIEAAVSGGLTAVGTATSSNMQTLTGGEGVV